MRYQKVTLSTLLLTILCTHTVSAADGRFITIIGPDGLPMVVPYPESTKAKTNSSQSKQTVQKTSELMPPKVEVVSAKQSQPTQIVQTPQVKVERILEKPISPSKALPAKALAQPKEVVAQKSPQQIETVKSDSDTSTPYQIVDGEKYYETEYLESKEFNLDQKKRFYQIPNVSGGSSWDIVEREKGVDMSLFRAPKDIEAKQKSIALGKDYKILSKISLEQVLPIQCIDDKSKRKAKDLTLDKPLGLWSREPIDDRFDYQLVKINQDTQNFKLTSFANNVNNPTYYWPMIIFLDEKGCVLEGASAFYTQSYPMTMLQNESIEGIVHIPEYSKFMMLIALEQAVDLPALKLSHHGQIKLTVLR